LLYKKKQKNLLTLYYRTFATGTYFEKTTKLCIKNSPKQKTKGMVLFEIPNAQAGLNIIFFQNIQNKIF
jgi:hypothetical protein